MIKHVEMIIDYLHDGSDYQYFDNKGILVRCEDCEHAEISCINPRMLYCPHMEGYVKEDDYCSYARRREQ